MRVAHLNTAKTWRGGEQQLLLLLRGLAEEAHGLELVLFAQPGSPLAERAAAAGVEVVPLAVRSSGDLFASLRLRRHLRARGFDVLHLHTAHAHSVGLRAARFLGPRRPAVVVTRHVTYSIYRHFPWALTWFKYTRGIARIVCVAEAVRAALRRAGIPERLLAVVHNGVDPTSFEPDAARTAACREALRIEADTPLVGSVGALTREKGQRDLLGAFALLEPARRGVHLVLVGEGPLHADLVAEAHRLGIGAYVHFPGFQQDVAAWLGALDLFVFPSRQEGLPMTVLEAMAAGRAILATTAGGIPELLRDGQEGVLVAPADGAGLSAALADLLDDPARRRRLALAARERARDAFDYRASARAILQVYADGKDGG